MNSTAPLLSELLSSSNYSALIFNGQLDIVCNPSLETNVLRNLNYTDVDSYLNAERCIWRVNDEIAGYAKQTEKLIQVMVRNAS